MQIQDLWGKISHSSTCKVFLLRSHDVPGSPTEGIAAGDDGIFSFPTEEQPVIVIDHTLSDKSRHTNLESKRLKIEEDGGRLTLSFEVALLEYINQESTLSSSIILNFFSEKMEKLSSRKINDTIRHNEVIEVRHEIDPPRGTGYLSVSIFVNSSNRISLAYTGFSLGDGVSTSSDLSEGLSKSVTMLVFNNFSNDTRVLREAMSLVDLGLRVRVIAIFSHGQKMSEVVEGVEVVRLPLEPFHIKWIRRWGSKPVIGRITNLIFRNLFMPFHRYLMFLEYEKMVVSSLIRERSDVYHAHDLNTLRAAKKLSSKHGSKLVYDSHELYLDRNRKKKAGFVKRRVIRAYEKSLIRKCDNVITVNYSIAEILTERYGIENVSVIMNTPPMQFFPTTKENFDLRKILDIEKGKKIAIYVGSIQFNRGIENLLESLRYLGDVHLVLLGYGDNKVLEKLDEIAQKYDLSDRYSLYGPVPSESVPLYTSSADIGVAPILNSCLSYYLCSPNKVFEYMHAGIPVVASDFPELRKVILGEEIGTVFDPEDPWNIADSIREIIANEGLESEFRKNSLNSSRKYNWGIQSRNLQKIYLDYFPLDEIIPHEGRHLPRLGNIERLLLPMANEEVSRLEVENSLPGNRGWGAPHGKESVEQFKSCLNSLIFQIGDRLEVYGIAREDNQLSGGIYRIGYYEGTGSRKIADLGTVEIESANEWWEEGVVDGPVADLPDDWSVIFSLQLNDDFPPGSYVLKLKTSEWDCILPFWIGGMGDLLAIVPAVANRIHSFGNESREKMGIYTRGSSVMGTSIVSGSIIHNYPNGRGGMIPTWTFPFCRWCEKNNIQVSWVTDEEFSNNYEEFQDYKTIVLTGDSRFWTEEMHRAIGLHVSKGFRLANIGCGMGEQIINFLGDGSFEFVSQSEFDEPGLAAMCESWSIEGSPTRFGGRAESAITLVPVGENGGGGEFNLRGSWDSVYSPIDGVSRNAILSMTGKSSDSDIIEVESSELRTQSGGKIFLASMENWSTILYGEDHQLKDDLVNSQRDYLGGLLKNSPERERTRLSLKRSAIEKIVEKEWGAEKITPQEELTQKRETTRIEKICFLTSFWKRHALSEAFLKHIKFLEGELREFDIDCVVVGSEGGLTEEMVKSFDFKYLEHENLPLSKKWDAGLKFTKNADPDVVIILGSDDFISPNTVRGLCKSLSEGRLMVGLIDMHLLDSNSSILYHWNGYGTTDPHKRWETIGMARCLSRMLLDKVGFSIWGGEDIDHGLDGLMTRNLSSIGLIPIPHGEEVWMRLDGKAYAFGHTGVHSEEISGFAVDVKTGDNITSIEKYNLPMHLEIGSALPLLIPNLGDSTSQTLIELRRN